MEGQSQKALQTCLLVTFGSGSTSPWCFPKESSELMVMNKSECWANLRPYQGTPTAMPDLGGCPH